MSTTDPVRVIAGDTVTVTITGKVVDPSLAGTPSATTFRITRPARRGTYPSILPADRGVAVDLTLDPSAKVEFTVTSQFKHGVHIDANGRYWMRRPDGWHEMTVTEKAAKVTGAEFVPKGVTRLKEAGGS